MKNLLLFSTILLTTAGAFAQLTVKPAGLGASATDSYIYVKDQILYVKGDVNLTKNNPLGDQVASIYLRNNGQLIQGGTGSNNSGNGYLSVQQNTKPTNAFAYYYWCSPVGNTTVGGVGNTNFGLGSIYQDTNARIGEGTKAQLSVNISGKEGFNDPLTISKRWMYIHPTPGTEAEGNYTRINASNGAKAGDGFTMKGVNTGDLGNNTATTTLDQLYEFRGRPNNGDFLIPVSGPVPTGNGTDAMMTLTGNPYPSALDLTQVFNESGNTSLNSIFYYDEDRTKMTHNYSGKPFGYGVWIPGVSGNGEFTNATFYIWNASGGSSGGTPSTRTDFPTRYAPIGQGFMFVGNSLGTVTIKNSHRVFEKEGSGSVFFRPTFDDTNYEETITQDDLSSISTSSEELDTRTPQMRLYVVFDDALTRDILLVFSDQASDGYDRGMDGLSPGGMKSDAYFPVGPDNDRLPYVINSVNYDESKQIPIAFKIKNTSKIRLVVAEEVKNHTKERTYLTVKKTLTNN